MATKITVDMIQQLRGKTGIGMMECKKALIDTDGQIDQAIDLLRKRGAKVAAKRAGQETKHGVVFSYIHPGSTLGVMVEVACETDFSAATDTLKDFARDISMQIAATNPLAISSDQLDPAIVAKEEEIYRSQLAEAGKPANVIDKIIEGKIRKYYQTACLLNQPYIKNDKITVQDHLNELIAKITESIKISRFCRFQIGG